MRDTALDEFVGGDDAASEQQTQDAGDAPDADFREAAATVEATGADKVPYEANADPPDVDAPRDQTVSTFVWSDEGAACSHCGAAATRRWRDDGDLVCPSCKTW